jgi:hypothetical protein
MQASEYFFSLEEWPQALAGPAIETAERAGEILRGYAKLRPLVARDLDSRRLL